MKAVGIKEPSLEEITSVMNKMDLGDCEFDKRDDEVFNYIEDKLENFKLNDTIF